jgi:hypothetical protein
MSSALPAPLRDPSQCLELMAELARRLTDRLSVTIRYTDMPDEDLGEWHGPTRTLHIRAGARIEDQTWLLTQAWLLLTIGPEATPAARPQPLLRLVPDQRAATN